MITIIAAMAKNSEGRYVIGKGGDIPWKSKTDMRHFSELTTGHPVIMGRKTWESLPSRYKPLPNRMNYVLTRDPEYVVTQSGAVTASSLEDALELIAKKTPFMEDIDYSNSFIIGGFSLYKESLKIADKMELTFMNKPYEGDTFFPDLDFEKINQGDDMTWKLVNEIIPDFKNTDKALMFKTYQRK
jgi:dihydrofolate reductase